MERMKWIKNSRMAGVLALSALLFGCNEADRFTDLVLPGTVEFEYETYNVPENIGESRIPVILSTANTKDITLTISIENRPDLLEKPDRIAQENEQFTLPAKEVTIRAGETYGSFPLSVLDDIIVNGDRMFDVKIESISDGAVPARISQVCRVVLKEDDSWPEVSFERQQYSIAGSETRMVIPLNVGGGIIRNPFTVGVAVEETSATEGVDFTIEKKAFTFTEGNREDSVVILLTAPQDMAADMSFKLLYEVNDAGITGAFPETEVLIRRVVKYVGFEKRINWIYENYQKILVPVSFTGLRTSKDVSAKIRIAEVQGIEMTDISLPFEYITTQGDTVANFEVTVVNTFAGNPDAAFQLEVEEVVDGELGAITTTWVRVQEAVELPRTTWTILGFSSEEATGEGATGRAKDILDGNNNTFWHNKWYGGAAPLPHHISVGFGGQAINVASVKIQRRMPSNRNTKTVKIDLAVDPEMMEFVEVGEVVFPNAAPQDLTFYLPAQMTAYGLKLRMPDSNSAPSCSLSEVWVYGAIQK